MTETIGEGQACSYERREKHERARGKVSRALAEEWSETEKRSVSCQQMSRPRAVTHGTSALTPSFFPTEQGGRALAVIRREGGEGMSPEDVTGPLLTSRRVSHADFCSQMKHNGGPGLLVRPKDARLETSQE